MVILIHTKLQNMALLMEERMLLGHTSKKMEHLFKDTELETQDLVFIAIMTFASKKCNRYGDFLRQKSIFADFLYCVG